MPIVDFLAVTMHDTSVSWDAVAGTDTVCFGGNPATTAEEKRAVVAGLIHRFPEAEVEVLCSDGFPPQLTLAESREFWESLRK